MKYKNYLEYKGFTLLEILLVIATIGILAAIVIVAINPQRQLAEARNAQRIADIREIYSSIQQYLIEQSGIFPDSVQIMSVGSSREICSEGVDEVTCSSLGLLYLGDLTPIYLAEIPQDPQSDQPRTGYILYRMQSDRFGIVAENSENQEVQSISQVPGGVKVAPQGLIHYFDLQQNTNNLSKLGNANMSWIGSQLYNLTGLTLPTISSNFAAQFNGSNHLTTGVSYLNNTSILTTAGWFRTTMPNQNRVPLWGQQGVMEVCLNPGSDIWFWHGEQWIYVEYFGDFNDGDWYHYTVTYNDGDVKIYINGINVTNDATYYRWIDEPWAGPPTVVSPDFFNIGGQVCDSGAGNFEGDIFDMRLYNRILSEQEIHELAERI